MGPALAHDNMATRSIVHHERREPEIQRINETWFDAWGSSAWWKINAYKREI